MKRAVPAFLPAFLAAFLLTGLTGCFGPAPDVAFLTSDAHFVVADQPVVLPVVALRSVSTLADHGGSTPAPDVAPAAAKDWLSAVAGQAATPARAAAVGVTIAEYRNHGGRGAARDVCPRLSRKWAQYLCRGDRIGVLADLPEQFELVDRQHLDRFQEQRTAGGERRADQLATMELVSGQPDVVCDRAAVACTAAVALSETVVAVWTVAGLPADEAEEAGRRQGAAVLTFVRNAIGAREAFERLGVPVMAPRA